MRFLIFFGAAAMQVSIWANHGSNIIGVSNNLHFTTFFANLRDPNPRGSEFIIAILNPAAFTKIQVEATAT